MQEEMYLIKQNIKIYSNVSLEFNIINFYYKFGFEAGL